MCGRKAGRFLFLLVLMHLNLGGCNAISNTQFNDSIRNYEVTEDNNSTHDVRTLQKELHDRYAQLAPVSSTIRFKEVPDSAISPSSTHGRGLLHLNHHGYGLTDYEESPYHGYAYEYHIPEHHHGHYDDHDHEHGHHHDHDSNHHEYYGHHLIHHDDHKYGYGHHYKHHDHALAAKTVLWPIAGIAFLGAAAALVSNPVLLQLGVVSGRRRRRDTEEVTTDQEGTFTKKGLENIVFHNLKSFDNNNESSFNTFHSKLNKRMGSKRGMLLNKAMNNKQMLLFRNVNPTVKAIQSVSNKPENNGDYLDKQYIPIPLMIKNTGSN